MCVCVCVWGGGGGGGGNDHPGDSGESPSILVTVVKVPPYWYTSTNMYTSVSSVWHVLEQQ